MQGKDILLVAPYQNLYDKACRIVEANGFPVEVIRGSMENIDRTIETVLQLEPEVVISRGGSYQALQERLSVPMVEIKISAYDILKACEDIDDDNSPLGFLGYGNVIFGMHILEKVVKRRVYAVNFEKRQSLESVEKHVRRLAKQGVRHFVCDNISCDVANQLGYIAKRVETDDTTLLLSIQEALHLLDVKLQERMVAHHYRIIMDSIDEGIVSVDRFHDEPLINRATEIFCRQNNISARELAVLLGLEAEQAAPQSEILTIRDNCVINIQKSPIELDNAFYGVVAKFQDITQIQRMEQRIRTELSSRGLTARYTFDDILYKSRIMEKVVGTARKFAGADATVLIQAATGTGKELFAQSIHNASLRANKPFVAINCAALPESLLESELFGYADGAFTGARKGGRAGLFELAHTGTIFLDEIGDMPLNLQARLLRVIQEKEVMRIGAEKIIPVDVRIIASTNVGLEAQVKEGKFRQDLYFRLNILSLKLPTLNERQEDIAIITRKLMEDLALNNNKQILGFEPDALKVLLEHNYHGNIRELRGIIERAIVISSTPYITTEDLDLPAASQHSIPCGRLKTMEREMLTQTLKECGGNYATTARVLGIDRTTLYRKMKAYS